MTKKLNIEGMMCAHCGRGPAPKALGGFHPHRPVRAVRSGKRRNGRPQGKIPRGLLNQSNSNLHPAGGGQSILLEHPLQHLHIGGDVQGVPLEQLVQLLLEALHHLCPSSSLDPAHGGGNVLPLYALGLRLGIGSEDLQGSGEVVAQKGMELGRPFRVALLILENLGGDDPDAVDLRREGRVSMESFTARISASTAFSSSTGAAFFSSVFPPAPGLGIVQPSPERTSRSPP